MTDVESTIELRFDLPPHPPQLSDNYFFGAWHPSATLSVDCAALRRLSEVETAARRNWFVAARRSPLHPGNSSLVHVGAPPGGETIAVAFRGYVLEPPAHSYSPSDAVLAYWTKPLGREHNGVFSAVVIADGGARLELVADAFGIGPLYYRTIGRTVLFATSPRYLTTPDDRPDYVAWRCLIQSGLLAADRSLIEGVRCVPAAHVASFNEAGGHAASWFDYAGLPAGERPVNDTAVSEAIEAFGTGLSRCLRLDGALPLLALSSGWDSRRILGGLLKSGVRFEAMTNRVFHKRSFDVDASVAARMGRDFGFRHRVTEENSRIGTPEDVHDYVGYDRIRRLIVDAETGENTCMVPFLMQLPTEPCFVMDGLAGDVLGNSGFVIQGLHDHPERDRDLIADDLVGDSHDRVLSDAWPSAADVRVDLLRYLTKLPDGRNASELAFLLLQSRRKTAPWTAQMLPPGHVAVCPYLDLDHVRGLLAFNPAQKYAVFMQRACLEKADPELSVYEGSRSMPPDVPRYPARFVDERYLGCYRQLERETASANVSGTLGGLLTGRGYDETACRGVQRRIRRTNDVGARTPDGGRGAGPHQSDVLDPRAEHVTTTCSRWVLRPSSWSRSHQVGTAVATCWRHTSRVRPPRGSGRRSVTATWSSTRCCGTCSGPTTSWTETTSRG
ncbi:MAG: hypothetical protein NTV05_11630 [Acidobacteria bacterium]|nr:hypothetical protein [Acidobacteriota bacterium]